MAEIIRLAEEGWQEGASKLARLSEDLSPPVNQHRRRVRRWGDFGDHLDMDRVRMGNIDQAWQSTHRVQAPSHRIIHLAVEISHLGAVEASEAFWPGATTCALADYLESQGYRVQITALRLGQNYLEDSELIAASFTLKEASKPLNVPSLAATCALVGFFRTVGLRWTAGHLRQNAGHGISYTKRRPQAFARSLLGDESTILVPGELDSMPAAREWLTHTIETLKESA